MKKALVLSGGGARGAYQAGVYQYLTEIGFVPDIITGTSVGAINAAAIGSGMDATTLINLWKSIESGKVIRYSLFRIFYDFLFKRFSPFADPGPLEELLHQSINTGKLRENQKQNVTITAVNIQNGDLVYFNKDEITIDHIMASSSIPMFFPWKEIDGIRYWDGGLMANIPILPAVEQGARKIIAVTMTPVGNYNMDLPRTRKQALERIFELFLIGSYQNIRESLSLQSGQKVQVFIDYICQNFRSVDIVTISPKGSFGFESLLNFSDKQANLLIERGYEDAREQLAGMEFSSGKK